MAEFDKDKVFQDLENEQKDFFDLITREQQRIGGLPPEEQEQQFKRLNVLTKQGKQNLRQKFSIAQAGLEPVEPPPESKEGALQFVLGSLIKPLSAVAGGVESLILEGQGKEKEAEKARSEALFNAIPFSETFTGEKGKVTTFKDVLETAGVGEGGKFSDLFPSLFNETGEGIRLKKGGFFDPTGRGSLGFSLDLAFDPLNFLGPGISKGAALAGGKIFKSVAGKSLREFAFDNPAIRQVAQSFNRFALLDRNPLKQEAIEDGLRNLQVSLDRIRPEEQTRVVQHLDEVFKDANDETVTFALRDLDDLTTLVQNKKFDKIEEFFPGISEKLGRESLRNGDVASQTIADIFVQESGLSEKQVRAFWLTRQFLEKERVQKLELNLLKSSETRANYFPRKIVFDSPLGDLNDDTLNQFLADESLVEEFERTIGGKNIRTEPAVSNITRDVIRTSLPEKKRVFETAREAADHVKVMRGRFINNIPELLFGAASSRRRKEAFITLVDDMTEIFGADRQLPKDVRTALNGILKRNDPQSWNIFTKTWNKWFLNPLKKSLTFPFPAYHVRNIIDDTFRGWEGFGLKWIDPQASKDALQVMGTTDRIIDLGNGLKFSAREIYDKLINVGTIRHSFDRADLQTSLTNIQKQLRKEADPTRRVLRRATEFLPISEAFATKFQNHARVKAAILSLKKQIKKNKITSPGDLDEVFLQAAKDSRKAFLDFADLGPIDDALAQFIPFYRFTRKNVPFQIETILSQPQRISKLAIANNDFQTDEFTEEDRALLSPYLKDNLTISIGEDTAGNAKLLTAVGLSIEEINKFWSTEGISDTLRKISFGQAAPPIQAFFGLISNKHPFFGTEFNEFRARQTYKGFFENKLLNKLVGGIQKIPQKRVDGKIEFRYELDDPRQYFKVMTIYSPVVAALSSRIPGAGAFIAGTLSPRGLQTFFGQLQDERIELSNKFLTNISGIRIKERNIDQLRIAKMIRAMRKEYEILLRESRRVKAWSRVGIELSEGKPNIDDDLEEFDNEIK